MNLNDINFPADLRSLSVSDLSALADQLRQYIIDTLSTHPGHLASSLGTVELTLALHYVFNTPDDKLIWDVGHQAYSHKILTGRRQSFATIRTYGGLSGFPRRDESIYDAFGTGHSSTSISAALGMAIASKLQGNTSRQHIAVIGDGSMTGGEAFEALNNAGVAKANILVVLNDNGISIDKAVGGLNRHLTRITSSPHYNRLKDYLWNQLGGNDISRSHSRHIHFYKRLTAFAKTAALGAPNLFESLGFRYFGPIDGHDVAQLVDTLRRLKALNGPRLLHVVTRKGKGMPTAEQNPVVYHAPGLFDASTGQQVSVSAPDSPLKYQEVFGRSIIELAQANPSIVAITPAMPTGCSLNLMMRQMPDRVFDVGIAEQHAVTFAAGLAVQGMLPFCNIYSSFMQRAFDQVIHDVALQRVNMVLCLDRAGLVGEDGPTHHGVFDLAALRPIPNLTICAPIDEHDLRDMMFTAQQPNQGPVVIRYPRGSSVHSDWQLPFHALAVGRGRCLHHGSHVAILSIGSIGSEALAAAQALERRGVSTAVYDMRYLKPLDTSLLDEVFRSPFRQIITLEDGVLSGGFGSAVLEYACLRHYDTARLSLLGIPDTFVTHGAVPQLRHDCGIDADAIINTVIF